MRKTKASRRESLPCRSCRFRTFVFPDTIEERVHFAAQVVEMRVAGADSYLNIFISLAGNPRVKGQLFPAGEEITHDVQVRSFVDDEASFPVNDLALGVMHDRANHRE